MPKPSELERLRKLVKKLKRENAMLRSLDKINKARVGDMLGKR